MPRSGSFLRTAIVAGLVAGMLDILEPIIFFYLRSHTSPMRILQSVASGALGRSAYSGGWPSALLGLVLHFCIAIAWAMLFTFLARYIPIMKQHAVPAGLIYGFLVYAAMNFLILPYTHVTPKPSHAPLMVFNAICAVVFLIGLPISLMTRRAA